MKKTVILFVHTNTWLVEMRRLARALRDSNQYIPIIHFVYNYPTLPLDKTTLETEGILYSQSPSSLPSGTLLKLLSRVILSVISRIPIVGLRNFLSPIPKTINYLQTSISEIAYYSSLISQNNASLVVLAGDLVGYNTSEIARAAKKVNVPCVIVPSTMSDGTEQAEAYFFDAQFDFKRGLNHITGTLWPRWRKNHKNKTLVRLPAEQIIAKEILRLSPPLPWVSSSTNADYVAAESRAMFDYYRGCGIPAKKLKLIGSLANDDMAKIYSSMPTHRSELVRNLNFPERRGIILTALPPDSLYMTGGRPECEFRSYSELTNAWIGILSKIKDFNTVVSLHPSVTYEQFEHLESENVKISTLPITELIPICDIFVASVSSTIRWAITCGKPVVNYDVYKYRYSDFNAVNGVIYVDDLNKFLEILQKMTTDVKYFDKVKEEITQEANNWGELDGNEGARMLNLFADTIKQYEEIPYGK